MRRLAPILLLLALLAAQLTAHHAFTPVYDEKRTVTVAGVVTELRFVNPHAMMSSA